MIYTDGVHLITTGNQEELHQFAIEIGLKREWYQEHKHPHYDILNRKIRANALRSGAKLVDQKTLVRKLKAGEQNA
jgi:hypothetical protein